MFLLSDEPLTWIPHYCSTFPWTFQGLSNIMSICDTEALVKAAFHTGESERRERERREGIGLEEEKDSVDRGRSRIREMSGRKEKKTKTYRPYSLVGQRTVQVGLIVEGVFA